MHSRERNSLELERQTSICVAGLGSKRADKNGAGSLGMDLDFSLLKNKGVSVFCTREWLGAAVIPAPPNWPHC